MVDNVLIVWRSPETCSTNACFRPGLERNAVEHAGDIAEALQEKLSVCLRLDRPNGDRGGVKSTLFGWTLWTLDEAFLVAICLCYQYLVKTLAHWWSLMCFLFRKGEGNIWTSMLVNKHGTISSPHPAPPKKKMTWRFGTGLPSNAKLKASKMIVLAMMTMFLQRFFAGCCDLKVFFRIKCRKAHRTLSSRHACKQAYCANHCKVHLPFFLLQFEMTGLRVQNQMEHQFKVHVFWDRAASGFNMFLVIIWVLLITI